MSYFAMTSYRCFPSICDLAVIASEAKQSRIAKKNWIASLAMTTYRNLVPLQTAAPLQTVFIKFAR
jgi:hypothetical protein